ncbi:RNA polymerase sigma factor [Allocoprobacillus halotolerans]|uniref:RNA polymerase sigma factor n=1 Tax=Allocoprobacillus halotolerans TaxID=2944914 RepID=UPI00338E47CF
MKRQELEIIYMQYYKPLLLYAFSLTHHKADAQDLVANTFVKALLSFKEGNIQAWLYRVLKNEFYNMYKKQKKNKFFKRRTSRKFNQSNFRVFSTRTKKMVI